MSSASENPVDLLPARMLNEFVYCPRLFYYEHVLGVFAHNADTLRGAAQHARVDSGKGALPKPGGRKKQAKGREDESGLPTKEETGENETASPAGSSDTKASDPASGAPDAAPGEVIHSRAVTLGSPRLGVIAKLDLVEVRREEGGDLFVNLRVCPVEYKSGAPREGDDGRELWDADRIQLGLQILLLRENGYLCDEGIVFYRQTRQRVRYNMTVEDEAWIQRTIAAARFASSRPMPPPLDASPKCPRCSLVSICLPDETNFLHPPPDAEAAPDHQLALPFDPAGMETADPEGNEEITPDFSLFDIPDPRLPSLKPASPVRRLVTPDRETRAIYINSTGAWVSKKGETIVVKERDKILGEYRLKDIHHLALFGPVQLSTALVQSLCEKEIPISYFSMGGWFFGMTHGHGLTNVMTRIEQFRIAGDADRALWLARLFIYGKIRNQRTLLMRNHVEAPPLAMRVLKHAASAALAANSVATLLGIEGAAALQYFRHFSGMVKAGSDEPDAPETKPVAPGQLQFTFDFSRRNRRPPTDPVNALLSFGYSLLARECAMAARVVGFDPYVGFLHQPRFGRTALALDIMEEFRPLLADSVVLSLINNRMLAPADFVRAGDAVNLSTAGRKTFLLAWEKRLSDVVTHPVFEYKVSYRRAIELQFRLLAKTITGEIEQYVPFMTR